MPVAVAAGHRDRHPRTTDAAGRADDATNGEYIRERETWAQGAAGRGVRDRKIGAAAAVREAARETAGAATGCGRAAGKGTAAELPASFAPTGRPFHRRAAEHPCDAHLEQSRWQRTWRRQRGRCYWPGDRGESQRHRWNAGAEGARWSAGANETEERSMR